MGAIANVATSVIFREFTAVLITKSQLKLNLNNILYGIYYIIIIIKKIHKIIIIIF